MDLFNDTGSGGSGDDDGDDDEGQRFKVVGKLASQAAENPTVIVLRLVAELGLTLPLIVFGVVGNIASFVVLCQLRRHKLQTTTTLLQVYTRVRFLANQSPIFN